MLVNVKNNRDYLHDQILSLIGQGEPNKHNHLCAETLKRRFQSNMDKQK